MFYILVNFQTLLSLQGFREEGRSKNQEIVLVSCSNKTHVSLATSFQMDTPRRQIEKLCPCLALILGGSLRDDL